MKKRRDRSQADSWKTRVHAITSADALIAKAEELCTDRGGNGQDNRNRGMKAALFFEAAARAYRRGSLGLAAYGAWTQAKTCYVQLAHKAGAARCEQQRSTVQSSWGDDNAAAKGTF